MVVRPQQGLLDGHIGSIAPQPDHLPLDNKIATGRHFGKAALPQALATIDTRRQCSACGFNTGILRVDSVTLQKARRRQQGEPQT